MDTKLGRGWRPYLCSPLVVGGFPRGELSCDFMHFDTSDSTNDYSEFNSVATACHLQQQRKQHQQQRPQQQPQQEQCVDGVTATFLTTTKFERLSGRIVATVAAVVKAANSTRRAWFQSSRQHRCVERIPEGYPPTVLGRVAS